jgi:hypothetical protein
MEALCAVFGVVGQRLEQFGIALFSHEGRGSLFRRRRETEGRE